MIYVVALGTGLRPEADDNNVVAGWVGFAVMVALIVAVVFILRSFTKQLKKVDAAKKAGVFGDQKPEEPKSSDQTSDQPPTRHQT